METILDSTLLAGTAANAARLRAMHQVLDTPRVFDDPLAFKILSRNEEGELRGSLQWFPPRALRELRALFAARSRYAEDALASARERSVNQYVVLGAGLDTFAYRNAQPPLRVFEVDHPSTQAWKRERLADSKIAIPPTVAFAPVDFEQEPLDQGLAHVGLDAARPAFFSLLGVTVYLTPAAVIGILRYIAARPGKSELVFDFAVPGPLRMASAGDPWITSFEPAALERTLREIGFRQVAVIGPEAINARYFDGRSDVLRVGAIIRFAHVRV